MDSLILILCVCIAWFSCVIFAKLLVKNGIVNLGYKSLTNTELQLLINIGGPIILLIGVGIAIMYFLAIIIVSITRTLSK